MNQFPATKNQRRFRRSLMTTMVCVGALLCATHPTMLLAAEEGRQEEAKPAEAAPASEAAKPAESSFTAAPKTAAPAAAATAAAPSPAASAGEARVGSSVFNDARIEQVLMSAANQTGKSITAFGKVPNSRVSVIEKDIPLEDLLNKIAQPNGWVWFKNEQDGSYGIADEAWYKANILPTKVITKIFRPDHVQASELEKSVRPMLTQGIGNITADPRTNKLIVSDLPEVIERIERLIREIDVQLFTRVFYIRHGVVADIAKKIEAYKSETGTIEVDEKTHQIVVSDLLANIKKMELLIDILDIGPEIDVYDVNNIGLEGKDLEDLKKIIDAIHTKDLLFEINDKQGVFILEDVPEVHDRVEQILAGFDRPVKQVLIQGEILTTTFTREFGLGVKRFVYSKDPLSLTTPIKIPAGEGGSVGFTEVGALDDFAALTGNTVSGAFIGQRSILEWEASFSDSNTKVLLQPRLLVKNQESSRIFVGREEPYLTTFFNDNSGGGTNNGSTRSTSQNTVTDGLTFEIKPSISNSELVEMEIQVDNDDAEVVQRQSTDGAVDLIARNRQSIETVLTIPSGQSRVIGGLITTSDGNSQGGVPFLAKIPYLGALFGAQSQSAGRANLQLFITPTIVEDVVPKETGKDGKRGRLVTGYDKVPGSFDLNQDQGEAGEESKTPATDELLSGESDSEAAIGDLLRDSTPRELDEVDRDSSFVPLPTGGGSGSPSTGGNNTPTTAPPTAPPPTNPAPTTGGSGSTDTGSGGSGSPATPPPAPSTQPETKF